MTTSLEISVKDHWDLKGYIQTELSSGGTYYIFTTDGHIVDIHGYDPLFPLEVKIPLSLAQELDKGTIPKTPLLHSPFQKSPLSVSIP